jgi:hypothetical protein
MRIPDQFAPKDGAVCKLKRSIYGLRQGPRAWNDRLTNDLKRLGYKAFQYAESIFWRSKFDMKIYLLVYVDDIMLISSSHNQTDIQYVKDEIAGLYKIKDLGKAVFFLGIKLDYDKDGNIKLSQARYIENILERFNLAESKKIATPMLQVSDIMKRRIRSK